MTHLVDQIPHEGLEMLKCGIAVPHMWQKAEELPERLLQELLCLHCCHKDALHKSPQKDQACQDVIRPVRDWLDLHVLHQNVRKIRPAQASTGLSMTCWNRMSAKLLMAAVSLDTLLPVV